MLVEADAGREREVRAEPHEHPAPLGVVQIKIVLDDPASRPTGDASDPLSYGGEGSWQVGSPGFSAATVAWTRLVAFSCKGRALCPSCGGRPQAGALRMIDGHAFGTGLHATTALCLEALDDEVRAWSPASVLDVGTGSGVLALAVLRAGVPRVVAVDTDAGAVRVAVENARLNGLAARLTLVRGGPEALSGAWPLVLANVLAAPLIAMAPTLVKRVARSGRMVLSGIRASLARDVEQAYRHVGMRQIDAQTRGG